MFKTAAKAVSIASWTYTSYFVVTGVSRLGYNVFKHVRNNSHHIEPSQP